MIALEVIRHAPADLYLDPENPRLAGEPFSVDDQEGILRWLWRNKSVNELVDSILANGFGIMRSYSRPRRGTVGL